MLNFWCGVVRFWVGDKYSYCVNRTTYFFEHTEQLFADRYLFWSCLAWLGLTIYGLSRLSGATLGKQYVAGVAIALFSLTAVAPAVELNQWSAQVRRISELAAVAMKLGMWNVSPVAEVSDYDPSQTYRAFVEMRKRNLGLLGASTSMRLGTSVRIPQTQLAVPITIAPVVGGSSTEQAMKMFAGELPPSLAALEEGAELWVADAEGMVIGQAAFTNTGGGARNILQLGLPTLAGFQGFVLGPRLPALLFAVDENDTAKGLARVLVSFAGVRQGR